ncbi:unnamed protein product [Phaedon cochleariae]|uniref:Zasp-like motif domain-containing protein n=1 Tax=Phaedon cochleariae TaxID=80249 RepID=A0A9N9SN06_PHACE|nr:unnamed protein product [Phaedon cochleariae]
MATHPRLVNKQFNSPIGLYSSQNVQEILEKNTQILANGAVGIDFHDSNVGKPANLQNSAVLRMLEEEENRRRKGYAPGAGTAPKRVAWPPPNESGPDSPYIEQNAVSGQGGPQYPSQSPNLLQRQPLAAPNQPPATPNQRAILQPLDVSLSASSPLPSPTLNQSPRAFKPAQPSAPARPWAPVSRPAAQQVPQGRPSELSPGVQVCPCPEPYYPVPRPQVCPSPVPYSVQSQAQGAHSPGVQVLGSPVPYARAPASQGFSMPQGAAAQSAPKVQASRPFEPPPSTITLRPQAPVSQVSPPVYASQPATATIKVKVSAKHLRGDQKWPPEGVKEKMSREAENLNASNSFLSLQGGKHLRGDLKWPPENVKVQAEEENRLRIELAKGPVCRPRRPNKDYTSFFAQNALNSTYPGYKIPPGTQFFRQF